MVVWPDEILALSGLLSDLDLNTGIVEDALEVAKGVLYQSPIVDLEMLLVQLFVVKHQLLLLVDRRHVLQPLRDCDERRIKLLIKVELQERVLDTVLKESKQLGVELVLWVFLCNL